MRLCEHPDFEQAILQASEHFRDRGLRPALIEKDYYVTEALRLIGDSVGDKIIFKGGTSLPKDGTSFIGFRRMWTSFSTRALTIRHLANDRSIGRSGACGMRSWVIRH